MQIAEAFVAIRPQADAAEFARAVDQAVGRTRPTVVVDADTDAAQAEIAGLDAAPVSVPVDADTTGAVGELKDLDAPPILVPVDVDVDEAEAKIEGFGNTARRAAVTFASAIGTAAFGSFVSEMTKGAAELEAAIGGTQAIFQEAAGTIDEFAVGAAKSAGLTERSARGLTSVMGALLRGAGFAADEAADAAVKIAQLGADLSALTGAGTAAEAVEALAATMRGEFDTAERFGISLSAAAVQAKALELGLATSSSEIDNHAKAVATLALLEERGAIATGTFAREAGTAAGAAQIAAAETGNAADQMGKNFLPVYAKASQVVGQLAGVFGALPGPIQTAAIGLIGLGIAAPIIANVTTAIKGMTAALAVSNLAKAASNIGGALAALASPQVALIAGAAALGAGFLNARQNAAQFRKEMRALGVDLAKGGDAAEKAAAQLAEIAGPQTATNLQRYADAVLAGSDSADEYATKAAEAALESASWGGELSRNAQAAASAKDGVDSYLESLDDAAKLTEEARIAQNEYAILLAQGTATERELAVARQKVVDATHAEAAVTDEVAAAQAEGKGNAEGLAGATGEVEDAARDAVSELEAFRDAIDAAFGVSLSTTEAMQRWEESVDNLRETLRENGATLDIHSKKGRANRDVIREMLENTLAYVELVREETGSTKIATQTMEDQIRILSDLAIQRGVAKDDVLDYVAALLGIPPEERTDIKNSADLAEAAVNDYQTELGKIPHEKHTEVFFDDDQARADAQALVDFLNSVLPTGVSLGAALNMPTPAPAAPPGGIRQQPPPNPVQGPPPGGVGSRDVSSITNVYNLQTPDVPTQVQLEAIKRTEAWNLQRTGRRA